MFYEIKPKASQFIPRLQSHRGWHQEGLFENTLESIQKAYQMGYQMVEFDVRLLADGTVMVFHDKSIAGVLLRQLTYLEFEKHFLKLSKQLTTLKDLLDWFAHKTDQNFKLNIEIKSNKLKPSLEPTVLNLIRHFSIEKRILISSFNPFTLSYFRKNAPEIFRSLLLTQEKHSSNNYFIRHKYFNFLARPNALHLREVDWNLYRDRYQTLVEKNIPVVLWTVNDLEKAKIYLREGITGVISDTIRPEEI